jgi:hypothetical protein
MTRIVTLERGAGDGNRRKRQDRKNGHGSQTLRSAAASPKPQSTNLSAQINRRTAIAPLRAYLSRFFAPNSNICSITVLSSTPL